MPLEVDTVDLEVPDLSVRIAAEPDLFPVRRPREPFDRGPVLDESTRRARAVRDRYAAAVVAEAWVIEIGERLSVAGQTDVVEVALRPDDRLAHRPLE